VGLSRQVVGMAIDPPSDSSRAAATNPPSDSSRAANRSRLARAIAGRAAPRAPEKARRAAPLVPGLARDVGSTEG
jgi:hypothetical protein